MVHKVGARTYEQGMWLRRHASRALVEVMGITPDGYTMELLLIDPIPATPAVPDLLCVDVGKMLQSAVGWESVRYQRPFRHGVSDLTRCLTLDEYEWEASSYWCGVHLLRTLPYVDPSIHK